MKIEYLNENLAPGHLGYFFIVLAFSSALLGLVSYLFYNKKEVQSWRNLARISFVLHVLSVAGIFTTLFYLIYHHYFEYNYVWAHSSRDLPWYYMISSFWEGQEGSFLLWTFWEGILGIILILTARKWEGRVMVVICLAQLMLSSMLLGQELPFGSLGTLKLGSNPFILMRNTNPGLPLFQNANYVSLIADGRGLNVLLQNYWMVIHPPVLFLGFASTIVPFAFAMAGLWSKKYGEWVKPAMPWAVFGCLILGTGILMGGAWAYEALSFGGFWAWDPVENSSLVPWILFIGGLHTMMIYRARKNSLGITYILITLTYILILYSTFLTRSGILGDTSVHSFTDLGLSGQLMIFMFGFVVLAGWTILRNWKKIPKTEKEESVWSREFWMFIGALILSLSALHIIAITSIPVLNKINALINSLAGSHFRTDFTKPVDTINAYHVLEIPFAIGIAFLAGLGQYFRWKRTDKSNFWKSTAVSAFISAMMTLTLALLVHLDTFKYVLLLWAAMFAVVANADYFVSLFKQKNMKLSGPSVAHIGFGILLAGALIANAKKETISINTENMATLNGASNKEQRENKVLFKDFPVFMGNYRVTYTGDSTAKDYVYYNVKYQKLDNDFKKIKEEFDLKPYVILDKQKGQITTPSPSTKHYITKDLFTHITAAANTSLPEYQVTYDTNFAFRVDSGNVISLDSFTIKVNDAVHEISVNNGDTSYRLALDLSVTDGTYQYKARPILEFIGGQVSYEPSEIHDFGLNFYYKMVHPNEKGMHELVVFKGNRPAPAFITMKAIVFPMINLLWLGAFVMIVGFFIALFRRIKEYRSGQ
jgi:cytochrome c-type biogenesis protein CcmF